jgi:hypothetical protein
VALTLARTRLMSARYPYYLLADSPEGRRKEAEVTGQVPPDATPAATHDIRRGFVYKRVPHVTLKSIANNPDIKEGMTREQIDAAIRRHAETEVLYDQPFASPTTSGWVQGLPPRRAFGLSSAGMTCGCSVHTRASDEVSTTYHLPSSRTPWTNAGLSP